MDYRLLCVIAFACWGGWGFVSKLATRSSSPPALALWATVASLVPIAAFAFTVGRTELRPTPLIALAGLLAGFATLAFYLALARGPASVVVPLTGMYILVPALLGIVLLHEPATLTRLLGMASAALAVFLLSR
ncbi:MAG TPA: EamA family transporter [candidate division WOR-3 bacterium]|uniref:EamA family transporter n=1 Tax=candidate division WOR-3 bacterium TaxID=2052148 RepID=A0A7V0T3W6_UNCW3|nr:EamA family transporter [candidate division WOR-3 bacterium]